MRVLGGLILVVFLPLFNASASLDMLYYYRVKVHLSDGKTLGGNTWGLSWLGGYYLQMQETKIIKLVTSGDKVDLTFYLNGNAEKKSFTVPVRDRRGNSNFLKLSSEYKLYDDKVDFPAYWEKKIVAIPIEKIVKIETVGIIGKGLPISDPGPYLNVHEPFLLVNDCGLGCPVKLFSGNPDTTKAELKTIWDSHLNCAAPIPESEKTEIKEKHKLTLISDPFCKD